MKQVLRSVVGFGLVLAVVVVVLLSALASEPESSFAGDQNLSFQAAPDSDIRRLGTGALALRNEPTLADATVVIRSATTPFTETELEALEGHATGGGTVLVLDTRGHGTQLTSRHGITFERVLLAEPVQAFPVQIGATTLQVSSQNASALLVRPGSDAEVLAWSSALSNLDRDGNGVIEEADPTGPFPVIARIELGTGSIWAIAAPAMFDPNADLRFDEVAMRDHLFAESKLVLIDEGHVESDDILLVAARFAWQFSADPWRWILLPVLALAFIAAGTKGAVPGLQLHRFDPRVLLKRQDLSNKEAKHAPSGLTERGRITLATALLCIILSVAFASHQAAWAGLILLVPTLGAYFFGPPNATAVRTVSARRVAEASPVRVDLNVHFKGSTAGIVVQDDLPGFFNVDGSALLQPRKRQEDLQYTVRPARLGRYNIGPLYAERSDPLGLRVQVSELVGATDVRVTPRLEDTRDSPFKTKVPQITSGGHQVNRAGGGTEFLALREYHQGDTMRMVNWKASARAKNLMVNQRVHETPLVLTLIVDTRAVSDCGPAESTPFVRAARSAASIAQETIAGRDRCKILLYGKGVHRVEGRGGDVLHKFQEHMADTRAEGATMFRSVVHEIHTEFRSGQPVVYVGAGEQDEGLEDALEMVRRRGSPVHVVMPMIEDLGDPETRAAAKTQRKLAGRLRGRGFPVYELEPNRRLEDAWRLMGAAS